MRLGLRKHDWKFQVRPRLCTLNPKPPGSLSKQALYELQTTFSHITIGQGFLIREDIRDYAELRDGPYVHPGRSVGSATIDSGSYDPWRGTFKISSLNPKP